MQHTATDVKKRETTYQKTYTRKSLPEKATNNARSAAVEHGWSRDPFRDHPVAVRDRAGLRVSSGPVGSASDFPARGGAFPVELGRRVENTTSFRPIGPREEPPRITPPKRGCCPCSGAKIMTLWVQAMSSSVLRSRPNFSDSDSDSSLEKSTPTPAWKNRLRLQLRLRHTSVFFHSRRAMF